MAVAIMTVGRVQRWIAESRTTADLRNGSELYAEFALRLCEPFTSDLVIPSRRTSGGVPNRVVAEADSADELEAKVEQALATARAWWAAQTPAGLDAAMVDPPEVTAVVAEGDYATAWASAHETLAALKRTRTFAPLVEFAPRLCSNTGRRAALTTSPQRGPDEREALSAEAWFKRKVHRGGFPSTRSIAAAPYLAAVVDAVNADVPGVAVAARQVSHCVDQLRAAAAGSWRGIGTNPYPALSALAAASDTLRSLAAQDLGWLDPTAWQVEPLTRELRDDPSVRAAANSGAAAATALKKTMDDRAAPSGHLAILHQDLDRLGRQLDGHRDRAWHERVSAALADLANAQIEAIEAQSVLGRVVYAGGDDLLALVPAEHALTAARSARELVAKHLGGVLPRPDVSCSVVFMPSAFPFQRALGLAREALNRSKLKERNRLTVQVLSGGTVRSSVTAAWTNDPVDRLLRLATSGLAGAQLAAGVERQRRQLVDTGLLRDEVRRLVGRSEALLGDHDRVVDDLFSTVPGCDALGIVELAHLVHKLGGFRCR